MKNLLATITEYKALKAQAESLLEKANEKKEELINYMQGKELEKLTCGQYTAKLITCTKKSLDEKFIRLNYPEVAKQAEKETEYKRFTV